MSSQHIIKYLFVTTALFTLAACANSFTTTPQATVGAPDGLENSVIVLGDISDDPGEVIEGTQPLADYLAARLGAYGVTAGQVKIARTTDEMTQLLSDGEVDLYFDSVYPATLVSDAAGGQPVLRRWRYGVKDYHTVIFASAESGVASKDDLPGNMIAMDSPYSTSGFLLPAVHLLEGGLTLVGKNSYNDPVAGEEVGFVFSYDDENTLQWVLSGLAAAGATDDYNFDQAFPAEATEKLVVLARTESLPRQVVVARPGIDPDLLASITQTLVAAHENEDGRAALEFFQTSRFDEFPEGIDAAQERMREMMEAVQGIQQP